MITKDHSTSTVNLLKAHIWVMRMANSVDDTVTQEESDKAHAEYEAMLKVHLETYGEAKIQVVRADADTVRIAVVYRGALLKSEDVPMSETQQQVETVFDLETWAYKEGYYIDGDKLPLEETP
jgi:hypothetical protein